MFVFLVVATPLSTLHEVDIKVPEKYKDFSDVFDKVKVNTLLEHGAEIVLK